MSAAGSLPSTPFQSQAPVFSAPALASTPQLNVAVPFAAAPQASPNPFLTPTHFPGVPQPLNPYVAASSLPATTMTGAPLLTSRAPPLLSALTNAASPPLPGAMVAGQNECTSAGGPPARHGEATPGFPPPGGSMTEGRASSPFRSGASQSAPSSASQSAPLGASLPALPSASQSAPLSAPLSAISSSSQPHVSVVTPSRFPVTPFTVNSENFNFENSENFENSGLSNPWPLPAATESANDFLRSMSGPALGGAATPRASVTSTQPPPEAPSVCLAPSDVETLLSSEDPALDSSFTPLNLNLPPVLEAVQQVAARVGARHPGYLIPDSFILLALELGRRQHGRLDVPSAVLRLKPPASPLSSSLGLITRLTLVPAAVDALFYSRLPPLDRNSEGLREAMCLLVEAARVQFPRSVVSVHQIYYAVEFSRTRDPARRIDLNVAFDALQPLSFVDASPTASDWDFVSINSLYADELSHSSDAALPATSPSRRRITPVPVPSFREVLQSSLNQSSSGSSANNATPVPCATPPLPRGTPPPSPAGRRVSFQDLGYQYRVGTKRQMPQDDARGIARKAGDSEDEEDLGDEDSEEEEEEEEEDDDDDDYTDNDDDNASVVSTASHKRKSSKTDSNEATLQLIRTLIEKINRSSNSSATLCKPPEFWYNGEAPKGGYFLETFTRLYGLYKNFVRITASTDVSSASGEECGLTFKNLITDDIERSVRSHLGLMSDSKWNSISNSDLIKALKSNLGFKDKDFYLSQLEEFQLPSALSAPSKVFNAFVTQTSDMLKIEGEALQTDVHLRKPTLKNLFQQYVGKHYRLNQWFHERSFKSLSKSIRHIMRQYKKQHVHDKRKVHESKQDARANGARSDFRGGKVESADAEVSRGDARRKADNRRGNRGRGRGGDRHDGSRRGQGDSVTSDHSSGSGFRGRGGLRGGVNKFSGGSEPRNSGKPDLRAAYAAEDSMPRGRFWHEKTSFCKDDNCRCRFCQGCGYHSTADDPGHDRPHCPNSKHADYVAAPKYFHEVHPGRKTALAPSSRPAKGNSVRDAPSTDQRDSPRSS